MKAYNVVYTVKGAEDVVQFEIENNLFELRFNELINLFNKYCDKNRFKKVRIIKIYPAENEEEN